VPPRKPDTLIYVIFRTIQVVSGSGFDLSASDMEIAPFRTSNRTEENKPMTITKKPALAVCVRRRFKGWIVCGTALVSFAGGSLLNAYLTHLNKVRADNHRVFELMVYHTLPEKVPELESIFREVSKLQAKHHLDVVGYWVPNDHPEWANTFIYLVAHPSREEAKKNWDALHSDPAFFEYRKQAVPLIERVDQEYRVDEVFMRPTDYSAMK